MTDRTAESWLLRTPSLTVAIAVPELAAVVFEPVLRQLPHAPAAAHRFLVWREQVVPILCLDSLAGLSAPSPDSTRHLAILSFFGGDGGRSLGHGGLLLTKPPESVAVTDAMACPLPDPTAFWGSRALACFRYQERAVPVLDLQRLFVG